MTLLDKIRLSRKFGKITYIISAILTVAMSLLVVSEPTAVSLVCSEGTEQASPVCSNVLWAASAAATQFCWNEKGASQRAPRRDGSR